MALPESDGELPPQERERERERERKRQAAEMEKRVAVMIKMGKIRQDRAAERAITAIKAHPYKATGVGAALALVGAAGYVAYKKKTARKSKRSSKKSKKSSRKSKQNIILNKDAN